MKGEDRIKLPYGWEIGTYNGREIVEQDLDEYIKKTFGITNISFRAVPGTEGDLRAHLHIASVHGHMDLPLSFTITPLEDPIIEPKIFSVVFLGLIEAVNNRPEGQSFEDALEEFMHSKVSAAISEMRPEE